MAVTVADFLIRFPEFADLADQRIELFLADAQLEVGQSAWGPLYEKGVFLLTAHFLQLNQNRQGGGNGSVESAPIASKSIGGVSISYARSASGSNIADWYLSTVYGSEYWQYVQRLGMGAVAVNDVIYANR